MAAIARNMSKLRARGSRPVYRDDDHFQVLDEVEPELLEYSPKGQGKSAQQRRRDSKVKKPALQGGPCVSCGCISSSRWKHVPSMNGSYCNSCSMVSQKSVPLETVSGTGERKDFPKQKGPDPVKTSLIQDALENDWEQIPSAPVFYPTIEEFRDPLVYIASIREVGMRAGIVKIVPPEGWKAPNPIDEKAFSFMTKSQDLHMLQRRDVSVAKPLRTFADEDEFHAAWMFHLGEKKIKAPSQVPFVLEGVCFSPMALYDAVMDIGGYYQVTLDKKWNYVAKLLHLPSTDAKRLKDMYWRYLYRFEVANTRVCSDELADVCEVCKRGDNEELMLLCDKCDLGFHNYCLDPPMHTIPDGEFFCSSCKQLDQPETTTENAEESKEYGFEEGDEYDLQHYRVMSSIFDNSWGAQNLSVDELEKIYWHVIDRRSMPVNVHYGSDVDPLSRPGMIDCSPMEPFREWNIKTWPSAEGSILSYLSDTIPGMSLPWVYVGMTFSSFCWHTEDHYAYSASYLHEGAPKVWYGVSGYDGHQFEEVMRSLMPSLFEVQPLLLFHLVTQLNPHVLMDHGVPVVRAIHTPGSYMVTFPKAYHAGFNSGFNLAEACNFALPNWIPWGRSAISVYEHYGRNQVFSHDLLLHKAALDYQRWDLDALRYIVDDYYFVFQRECQERAAIRQSSYLASVFLSEVPRHREKQGTESREMARIRSRGTKKLAEYRPCLGAAPVEDDECHMCHAVLYFSAIGCACHPQKVSCLAHWDRVCDICDKSKLIFYYSHTVDEIECLYLDLKSVYEQSKGQTFPLGSTLSEVDSAVVKPEVNAAVKVQPMEDDDEDSEIATVTEQAIIAWTDSVVKAMTSRCSRAEFNQLIDVLYKLHPQAMSDSEGSWLLAGEVLSAALFLQSCDNLLIGNVVVKRDLLVEAAQRSRNFWVCDKDLVRALETLVENLFNVSDKLTSFLQQPKKSLGDAKALLASLPQNAPDLLEFGELHQVMDEAMAYEGRVHSLLASLKGDNPEYLSLYQLGALIESGRQLSLATPEIELVKEWKRYTDAWNYDVPKVLAKKPDLAEISALLMDVSEIPVFLEKRVYLQNLQNRLLEIQAAIERYGQEYSVQEIQQGPFRALLNEYRSLPSRVANEAVLEQLDRVVAWQSDVQFFLHSRKHIGRESFVSFFGRALLLGVSEEHPFCKSLQALLDDTDRWDAATQKLLAQDEPAAMQDVYDFLQQEKLLRIKGAASSLQELNRIVNEHNRIKELVTPLFKHKFFRHVPASDKFSQADLLNAMQAAEGMHPIVPPELKQLQEIQGKFEELTTRVAEALESADVRFVEKTITMGYDSPVHNETGIADLILRKKYLGWKEKYSKVLCTDKSSVVIKFEEAEECMCAFIDDGIAEASALLEDEEYKHLVSRLQEAQTWIEKADILIMSFNEEPVDPETRPKSDEFSEHSEARLDLDLLVNHVSFDAIEESMLHWLHTAEEMEKNPGNYHVAVVKTHIANEKKLPFRLKEVENLHRLLDSVTSWVHDFEGIWGSYGPAFQVVPFLQDSLFAFAHSEHLVEEASREQSHHTEEGNVEEKTSVTEDSVMEIVELPVEVADGEPRGNQLTVLETEDKSGDDTVQLVVFEEKTFPYDEALTYLKHALSWERKCWICAQSEQETSPINTTCSKCNRKFHADCMKVSESSENPYHCPQCSQVDDVHAISSYEIPANRQTYCYCEKVYEEDHFMVKCDTCHNWYHGPCVGIAESQQSGVFNSKVFDCPLCCHRLGKRYKYKNVLFYVKSLIPWCCTCRTFGRDATFVDEQGVRVLAPCSDCGAFVHIPGKCPSSRPSSTFLGGKLRCLPCAFLAKQKAGGTVGQLKESVFRVHLSSLEAYLESCNAQNLCQSEEKWLLERCIAVLRKLKEDIVAFVSNTSIDELDRNTRLMTLMLLAFKIGIDCGDETDTLLNAMETL